MRMMTKMQRTDTLIRPELMGKTFKSMMAGREKGPGNCNARGERKARVLLLVLRLYDI